MNEQVTFTHHVRPGQGLPLAREHYGHGIGWLHRQEAADSPESRIRCATMAMAHFAGGQLALAIDASASGTGSTTEGNGR